ncbi:GntR family transcriptional regulator [Fodinicurvata sp. EGI_FJ10296]|uniref:GntR family transcriptional regulator n=1 Tax=Fodinicurvata sp. EGI_FJ10296 TaxID=3231908 RepID=UPI00345608E1
MVAGTGTGKPRYLKVADRLVEDIVAGTYPVDSLLPTEARLCRLYDVSRITAREALRHVQSLGLISRRQGVGSRVVTDTLDRSYAQSWGSIEDIMQYARLTRLDPVTMETVEADAALAAALKCQPGQRFLHIEGPRMAPASQRQGGSQATGAEEAICWTDIYVAHAYAGVQDHLGTYRGAIASLVEELYDERISDIAQEIRPEQLPDPIADALEAPRGGLALRIDRRYTGQDGRAFEISSSRHPADRFTYAMRLSRTS